MAKKPKFKIGIVVAILILCISSTVVIAGEIIKISFDKDTLELKVGETQQLNVNYETITTQENAVYVAPSGNDSNDGSLTAPLKSIQAALDSAAPGDTIYLREGKYIGNNYVEKSGSKEGGYITITSYEGEKAVISTPENVSGAAFELNGQSYIRITNITIADMKAKDVFGILMNGGEHHIYIDNCEFSNIVTTSPGTKSKPGGESNAILLLGEGKTASDSINNIYITNNTVHDIVNGWSENISVAGNCEYVYIRDNKVYDCTNIGIDFYGNAEYCPNKSLDQPRHCECTGNLVYNCNCFYAENAGIYVDGSYDILVKDNEIHHNFYGIEVGSEEWRSFYDDNNRVREILVENNNIHDNSDCGLRIGGWSNKSDTGVVYNCTIQNNTFSHNGDDEIIIAKCDTIYFKNNSFADGATYEDVVYYDEEIDRSKITNIFFE